MSAGDTRKLTIAVTGGTGSLAGDILPGILDAGYRIRCIDRRLPEMTKGLVAGTELTSSDDDDAVAWVRTDITDLAGLREALRGCDVLVHLGGIPLEDTWENLLTNNIDGTYKVLRAAHEVGIDRVVLASSIHAAGYEPVPVDPRNLAASESRPEEERMLSADVPPFPNTLYGVSKASMEALGRYFSRRFGLEVVSLRIASRFTEPTDERMLSTWLSPADATRLVLAAVSAPLEEGFRQVWGVSANTRRFLSLEEGRRIGYHPEDDAELYAPGILGLEGPETGERPPWELTLGGIFSSPHPPSMDARKQDIRPATDVMTDSDVKDKRGDSGS